MECEKQPIRPGSIQACDDIITRQNENFLCRLHFIKGHQRKIRRHHKHQPQKIIQRDCRRRGKHEGKIDLMPLHGQKKHGINPLAVCGKAFDLHENPNQNQKQTKREQNRQQAMVNHHIVRAKHLGIIIIILRRSCRHCGGNEKAHRQNHADQGDNLRPFLPQPAIQIITQLPYIFHTSSPHSSCNSSVTVCNVSPFSFACATKSATKPAVSSRRSLAKTVSSQ